VYIDGRPVLVLPGFPMGPVGNLQAEPQ
jgi:hypothetical protein